MKTFLRIVVILSSSVLAEKCLTMESQGEFETGQFSLKNSKTELARCLTANGWVMYSSATCSACSAQKKLFEAAFSEIRHIECNPHVEDTRVELCLANKIRKTPTWIKEVNGREIRRVEGYYSLSDLGLLSGCDSVKNN